MGGPAMRFARLLARLLGFGLAALLLAAAAALWWAGQTTSFARFALERAAAASGGALEVGAVHGSLAGGVGVSWLRWRDAAREVEAREVRVALRPERLLRGELRLARVEIGSASVRMAVSEAAPALPPSLELPLGLRLDALGIGRLAVTSGEAAPIVLERVALAGRYRDGAWRIAHLSARAPGYGEASASGTLAARPPYAFEASGRVDARLPERGPLPAVRWLADGTLADFALAAQALAPEVAATPGEPQATRPLWIGFDTRVRPLAWPDGQWLAPVELAFNGVEPAQLGFAVAQLGLAGVPRARVSGTATIRVHRDGVAGGVDLRNALPGRIDRQSIPVGALATAFAWSGARLELTGLRADFDGGGSASGDAAIDFGRRIDLPGRSLPSVKGELALREVDLSRWSADAPKTRLGGRIAADAGAVRAELVDAERRGIEAALNARIDGDTLHIERAQLATPAGTVSARGRATRGARTATKTAATKTAATKTTARGGVTLAGPWEVDLSGEFRDFDPAAALALRGVFAGGASGVRDGDEAPWESWAARAGGRFSGRFEAAGAAWPDPRLRVRLVVEHGLFDGLPVRADLRGAASRARLADAALDVALGEIRASAHGAVGAPGDRMRFALEVPALARVDPRLRGAVSANGELGTRAEGAPGAIDWSRLAIAARFEARGLRWGDMARVDRANGSIDGELGAHALRLEATGPRLAIRLAARGGAGAGAGAGGSGWHWDGTLDELVADEPVALRLQAPARLTAGAQGAELRDATLTVDGGNLRLAALEWREGRIETRGEASALPVARWAERFSGQQALAGVEARLRDVRLRGSWELAGESPDSASGRIVLRLDAGDAVDARGAADITLEGGRLDGSIDLVSTTLAFANRLIGPEWAIAGQLRFAGRVGGTIAQPRLRGELSGRELTLVQRAMGWRLGNGTLDARFEGDRLDLQGLRLESGGGSIEMAGQMLIDGMHGGFTLRADRLPVPIGPGQRVVVSGLTGIASSGKRFEWKGNIRADEGLIELRGGDAPALPDDVVIVDRRAAAAGEAAAPAAEPAAAGFAIGADLDLDLGERLRVRGSGIDVLLAGTLNLRGTLPAAPRAYGTVRVSEGTYRAYGQRLDITRGQVVFNGPLDNPVLDIVAMRRDQPVEAGVALGGTVLSPRLRLVSTPDVPDSQKLSWLVLGVGLDDARSAGQGAALQAAAATLFGSNDGGLSAGLAGALGLDVLTVRAAGAGGLFDPAFGATFPGQASGGGVPAGGAAQDVVAIGKRLSSRVFLTYEQGLRGVWNLLRIQYDITERLSIRAQAGTENAIDVLYFWSFD